MKRRRWRTAGLWVGCTLCVLIAGTFVASRWWEFAFQAGDPCIIINSGVVVVGIENLGVNYFQAFREDADWTSAMTLPSDWGWEFPERSTLHVIVPLYAVFAAVAIPTLLVWRFVPKFPRGHCRRCGYNLTGLREARCPECGQPFEAKGVAP